MKSGLRADCFRRLLVSPVFSHELLLLWVMSVSSIKTLCPALQPPCYRSSQELTALRVRQAGWRIVFRVEGRHALLLSRDGFGVRFPVRVEEFFSPLLPRRFHFLRRNVPIRPAFLYHCTQILTQLFQRWP